MEIKERLEWYQENAKRTCKDMGSESANLAHMVIGIFSEDNEVLNAIYNKDDINLGEEHADQLFYIANYCTYRGYSLYELYINQRDFELIEVEQNSDLYYYSVSKLQDIVKKNFVYNREIDKALEESLLKKIIWSICDTLDSFEIDIHNILQNNIDKLKVRYPNVFSEEAANNRDVKKERKELEK